MDIKIIVAAFTLMLATGSAMAKGKRSAGKAHINHDDSCSDMGSWQDATLTVNETPGEATVLIESETMQDLTSVVMMMDDRSSAARQNAYTFPIQEEEVPEIARRSKMASLTMLKTSGLEAFTMRVCHENE